MSIRMPPVWARWKNQSGRVRRFRRCGPKPAVCTTRPIAPDWTSSAARVTAGTSKRSEKSIDQMRPGRLLRGPDRVELGLRDHARLVDHHVLAVAHGRDRDVGALARNAGRDDQLHLRVVQQRLRVRHALEVGKALDEALQRHRVVARVKTLAFGAERQQAADLMVDVAVIEPDRGELEGWMVRHAGPGFSLRAP